MRKLCLLIFPLLLLNISCGTFNNRYHFFGGAVENDTENVALLLCTEHISIRAINGQRVNFNRTTGDKVIYLPAGEYAFTVRYRQYFPGAQKTLYTNDVNLNPYTLDGGKHYVLMVITMLEDQAIFILRERASPIDTSI